MMKKNVIWALCGFCGGLMPSLFFVKYIFVRLMRMKKWYRYMPAIAKHLQSSHREEAEKLK